METLTNPIGDADHVVTHGPADVIVSLQLDHNGDAYVAGDLPDVIVRGYAHNAGDDDYWTQLPSATAALVMGY